MKIKQVGSKPIGLTLPYDARAEDVPTEIKTRMLLAARALAREVRMRIRAQVYNWPDLSEKYLQWKEEQGLDTRMLIAYGYYINSINAWETPTGVQVGIGGIAGEEPFHKRSGLSLRLIGRWLEYGTFNEDNSVRMPARPHWRPTILDWKNNKFPSEKAKIKELMVAKAKRDLRDRLRKQIHPL
jgi:hypothetical protein